MCHKGREDSHVGEISTDLGRARRKQQHRAPEVRDSCASMREHNRVGREELVRCTLHHPQPCLAKKKNRHTRRRRARMRSANTRRNVLSVRFNQEKSITIASKQEKQKQCEFRCYKVFCKAVIDSDGAEAARKNKTKTCNGNERDSFPECASNKRARRTGVTTAARGYAPRSRQHNETDEYAGTSRKGLDLIHFTGRHSPTEREKRR